jgi:hypothetical protein
MDIADSRCTSSTSATPLDRSSTKFALKFYLRGKSETEKVQMVLQVPKNLIQPNWNTKSNQAQLKWQHFTATSLHQLLDAGGLTIPPDVVSELVQWL